MDAKAQNLVKVIGEKIITALFEQDDFEIESDPEFGGTDASIQVGFEHGNCYGTCDVRYHAHRSTDIWLELFHRNDNHSLERIEEAVSQYLEANLQIWSLLSQMREKYKQAHEDEWESHGFRNEADYYHWRYSA